MPRGSDNPVGADSPIPEAGRARYRRILRFAAKYLVQTWWYELFLPRIGMTRIAERTRHRRMRRIARHFHALALDLGGLMIKVGQYLSSRLDVLPPEITAELEGLQDEVPPARFDAVRALAETELGMPLDVAYASVDPNPVAAASLGQAYRATAHPDDAADTGLSALIVKVQRPAIETIVEIDLAALRKVGRWLSRVRIVADRVDMSALVEEFAATSREEVDYLHEAAAAERFAADFAGDSRVTVPEVVWERTTRRVLTLEDVTAIKITDVEALRAAGIDPGDVASAFAAIMFDQLFTHGYFHADPHPGNIFVTPTGVGPGWRLTFIDFGMMGEVSPTLRTGLRRLLIAVATRDSARLVDAVREIGILLPSADTGELERALTHLFARFGGMGFAELRDVDPREFRDFAEEFGEVVRSLPLQLPEDFLLIVRAMSLTSGVCSSLVPDFNLWDAVEPYAARLIRDEAGGAVQEVVQQARSVVGALWRLPERAERVIGRIEEGRVSVDVSGLERRVARIERLAGRAVSAILFTGLVIGGALLRVDDVVFGTVLMALSAVPLGYTLFAGLFRPRNGRGR